MSDPQRIGLAIGALAIWLLALCFALSEPRSQGYDQPFSPPVAGAPGATLIESDNFDTTGEGTDCAASVTIDDRANTPDCDSVTQVIGGQSLFLSQTSPGDAVNYTVAGMSDGTFEVRGYIRPSCTGTTGLTPGRNIIAQTGTRTDAAWIAMAFDANVNTFQINVGVADNVSATTQALTDDTWYKFCLRYDIDNDDAEAYLDPSAGSFCAGATWSATADNTSTDITAITSFELGRFAGSPDTDLNQHYDEVEWYDNG